MAKVLQAGPNGVPKEINLGTIIDADLTYTKNDIEFNKTVASGYTYSRFNPSITDGYEISVEDGGEFVIL